MSPWLGAVLNAHEHRGSTQPPCAFILAHGESQAHPRRPGVRPPGIADALARPGNPGAPRHRHPGPPSPPPNGPDRHAWTTKPSSPTGDPAYVCVNFPPDEWDAIALNYTSGTTGNPKGVVYHHRGAYLNAVGNAMESWGIGPAPRLPLDAAAVPLQRLVFPLGGRCHGRHQYLPAPPRSPPPSWTAIATPRRHPTCAAPPSSSTWS